MSYLVLVHFSSCIQYIALVRKNLPVSRWIRDPQSLHAKPTVSLNEVTATTPPFETDVLRSYRRHMSAGSAKHDTELIFVTTQPAVFRTVNFCPEVELGDCPRSAGDCTSSFVRQTIHCMTLPPSQVRANNFRRVSVSCFWGRWPYVQETVST
ncbi:hypothetical protein BDM02DRAFT_714011 [Thelephora ganbajun]|uniref:Uncharacterized protein n=1 Tax=Thelephora ganbajun TaxID=370292 RepID=A0ACB6Z652_THEGA|nr:hypothetical protein BDM02DRAFT_714011 [Thelephora ganbajun]